MASNARAELHRRNNSSRSARLPCLPLLPLLTLPPLLPLLPVPPFPPFLPFLPYHGIVRFEYCRPISAVFSLAAPIITPSLIISTTLSAFIEFRKKILL